MVNKKDFHTYPEAQAAIQVLGIKGEPDYQKRYKQDPKLPASPAKFYAKIGWTDWYAFLGNKRPNYYATYAEAQAAAQALGIKSDRQFRIFRIALAIISATLGPQCLGCSLGLGISGVECGFFSAQEDVPARPADVGIYLVGGGG